MLPGVVIELVYESLRTFFPQQKLVTWLIYAMAAFLIGIATCACSHWSIERAAVAI